MRAAALAWAMAPEAAWAWWTDFREGGEDHAFAAWARPERRVEEREDGSLLITESARFLGLRFLEVCEVRPARPALRFEARNSFGVFRGQYRFVAAPVGTRVEAEARLAPGLRALGPLGRWLAERFFLWDLRHHVRAMERDLAPGARG